MVAQHEATSLPSSTVSGNGAESGRLQLSSTRSPFSIDQIEGAFSPTLEEETENSAVFLNNLAIQLRKGDITLEVHEAGYPLLITNPTELTNLLKRIVNDGESDQSNGQHGVVVGEKFVIKVVKGKENFYRIYATLKDPETSRLVGRSTYSVEMQVCPSAEVAKVSVGELEPPMSIPEENAPPTLPDFPEPEAAVVKQNGGHTRSAEGASEPEETQPESFEVALPSDVFINQLSALNYDKMVGVLAQGMNFEVMQGPTRLQDEVIESLEQLNGILLRIPSTMSIGSREYRQRLVVKTLSDGSYEVSGQYLDEDSEARNVVTSGFLDVKLTLVPVLPEQSEMLPEEEPGEAPEYEAPVVGEEEPFGFEVQEAPESILFQYDQLMSKVKEWFAGLDENDDYLCTDLVPNDSDELTPAGEPTTFSSADELAAFLVDYENRAHDEGLEVWYEEQMTRADGQHQFSILTRDRDGQFELQAVEILEVKRAEVVDRPALLNRSQLIAVTESWFVEHEGEVFTLINHLPTGIEESGKVHSSQELSRILRQFENTLPADPRRLGGKVQARYSLPGNDSEGKYLFQVYTQAKDSQPQYSLQLELVPHKKEALVTPEHPLELQVDGAALHQFLSDLKVDSWSEDELERKRNAYESSLGADIRLGNIEAQLIFDPQNNEWLMIHRGRTYALNTQESKNYPAWIRQLLSGLTNKSIDLDDLENLTVQPERNNWRSLRSQEIDDLKAAEWLLISGDPNEYLFAEPGQTVGEQLDAALRLRFGLTRGENLYRQLDCLSSDNQTFILRAKPRNRHEEANAPRVVVEQLTEAEVTARLDMVARFLWKIPEQEKTVEFLNKNKSPQVDRVDIYASEVIAQRLKSILQQTPGEGLNKLASAMQVLKAEFSSDVLVSSSTLRELSHTWALPVVRDSTAPLGKSADQVKLENTFLGRYVKCIDHVARAEVNQIIADELMAPLSPQESSYAENTLGIRPGLFNKHLEARNQAAHDLPIVYQAVLETVLGNEALSAETLQKVELFFRFLDAPEPPARGEDQLKVTEEEFYAAMRAYARDLAQHVKSGQYDRSPVTPAEVELKFSELQQALQLNKADLELFAQEKIKQERQKSRYRSNSVNQYDIRQRMNEYLGAANLIDEIRDQIRAEGREIRRVINIVSEQIAEQLENPALVDIPNNSIDYLQACLDILRDRVEELLAAYEKFTQESEIDYVESSPASPPPPPASPSRAVGSPRRPTYTQADVATYPARQQARVEAAQVLTPPEGEEELDEDELAQILEYLQGEARAGQEVKIIGGVDRIMSKIKSGVVRREQTDPIFQNIADELIANTPPEEVIAMITDPRTINIFRSVFQTNKQEMSDEVFAEVLIEIAEQYYME